MRKSVLWNGNTCKEQQIWNVCLFYFKQNHNFLALGHPKVYTNWHLIVVIEELHNKAWGVNSNFTVPFKKYFWLKCQIKHLVFSIYFAEFLSEKIEAAFRGMHVSPAKHSFGKCDRKVWQTDRQTTDKTIPMCRYASQATQQWNEQGCTVSFYYMITDSWANTILFVSCTSAVNYVTICINAAMLCIT